METEVQHEPLEVRRFEGWLLVVKCSCDPETMPTTSHWLTDHFQGDVAAGEALLRQVVTRQREAAKP